MSFQAGGREAHAHQKAAQDTRSPLEEIQIRRHAQQVQKAHLSGRFPLRAEALQYGLYLSIMCFHIILESIIVFVCVFRLKIVKMVIKSTI